MQEFSAKYDCFTKHIHVYLGEKALDLMISHDLPKMLLFFIRFILGLHGSRRKTKKKKLFLLVEKNCTINHVNGYLIKYLVFYVGLNILTSGNSDIFWR